jgi:hypothetical protein
LEQWCEEDYDFIGPPWIRHKDTPYAGNSRYEGKVGNGGFSLRKVKSFLRVLYSNKKFMKPSEYWKHYKIRPWYIRLLNIHKKFLKQFYYFNNVRHEIKSYPFNEESFWANRAKYYYPEFKIPSVIEALPFGFECVPKYCYQKNNKKLPFGCHAWTKYEKKFWEPFILK